MDTEVYKIRIDQWRKLIYEANTCGMKKTEWCRQNGVTIKQFYYWQKKIRALVLSGKLDDAPFVSLFGDEPHSKGGPSAHCLI